MENKTKNIALLIDVQNDFCSSWGSLYVPGAEQSNSNITSFLEKNRLSFSKIILTADSHKKDSVFHKNMWINPEGNLPKDFTIITYQNIIDNAWRVKPEFDAERAYDYVRILESLGGLLIIWPDHCITDTKGAMFVKDVFRSVLTWSEKTETPYYIHYKGTNKYSEHYGIFKTEVPDLNDADSQVSNKLIEMLDSGDKIYIMGQAKNFCVIKTITQMINYAPRLVKKLIFLNDCTNNVPGGPSGSEGITFADLAQPHFDKAIEMGMQFVNSIEIEL